MISLRIEIAIVALVLLWSRDFGRGSNRGRNFRHQKVAK